MDLPDCPPGAEGYQDTVTEVPKKLEDTCTKAEQEFQEHLNSLKIRLEDGSTRCMVERRGRDIACKWIYLCYPCAAVCSGESILQTHISGKKHKTKLAMYTEWPLSIFEDHPYNQTHKEKGGGASEKVLQKMAAEVDLHNVKPDDLDAKYSRYRTVRCHIQDALDAIKAPLIGMEYLIEHPPEESHYEPSYICTLCLKQGHPRTIINHLTCFRHRYCYLVRHFNKAASLLKPFRLSPKSREGVGIVLSRIMQRIEDKYGRMKPINIDKEEYEKDKDRIHQWLFRGPHFSENDGCTFEEVVDVDLIASLDNSVDAEHPPKLNRGKRDPSPPVVAAPSKPHNRRQERRLSMESLSDISDDLEIKPNRDDGRPYRDRPEASRNRYEPYDKQRDKIPVESFRTKFAPRIPTDKRLYEKRPPNHEYKLKLAEEKQQAAEEFAKKTLAYHEKNPEKHPLYPEEWKKFWNRRYKEIQAEGKDPSKHDFKPEWIVFWTKRMKELHDEELRVNITEIYRRLTLPPPEPRRELDFNPKRRDPDPKRREPEPKRREPETQKRSFERRRTPENRRRSPFRRDRRSPVRRSPARRSPPRRSPPRRASPLRRPSPPRRSPIPRRSPPPLVRRPSPQRNLRTHSRSPPRRPGSSRRSRSPLARRAAAQPTRNRSPLAPSLQTVLVSDDELNPDDGHSPWNSDNEMESLGSLGSRAASVSSRRTGGSRGVAGMGGMGGADDVVGTLRLLVALEEHLGSLGPRVVALLGEALRLEKARPLGAEELLDREDALGLLETAKERLKGAAQAQLLPAAAAPAARAAVVRAAATLHEADLRASRRLQESSSSGSKSGGAPVSVAGVGAVDRAQIAQQMAAALIAQGKTDVSSEELAQLVDAVVGMAEAKKREAEAKAKPPPRPSDHKQLYSGTATALQMLQSAYDENDKKPAEKEDAPDAMDGLSDSDLETLLKNFNELSAEEQHSLIAYLKKLEAREPHRVERLRQYVSADAPTAAAPVEKVQPTPQETPATLHAVTIESDDDDYTVEEVFKSATQKVKEDQIRQEMEIVKKSLETQPPEKVASPKPETSVDLGMNFSSASDLLALVQASIQSASATAPKVVPSADQPRSFGDTPQLMTSETPKPLIPNPSPLLQNPHPLLTQTPIQNLQGMSRPNENYDGGRNTSNQGQSPMGFEGGRNMLDNHSPNQMAFDLHNNQGYENGRDMSHNQGQNQMNYDGGRNMGNNPGTNYDGGRNYPNNQGQNNMNYDGGRNMANSQGQNNLNFQGGRNMPNNQSQNNSNFEGGRNMPNNPGQNNMNYDGGRIMSNQGPNNMNYEGGRNMPPNNQGQNNMNFDGGRNMPNTQGQNMGFEGGRNMQNQTHFDGGRNMNNQGQRPPRPLISNTPMRGQGYNNYNQGGPYNNQGGRGNFNNTNIRPQQFGNYDNHNQNFRGRGRGHFGGRGRGRGHY